MGKRAKTSRKGKKEWRANIKTDEFDAFVKKTTEDTLAGANNLDKIPKDSLFVIDKSTDIPIKRKIEKHREKVLYHESVLQRNAFVTPIPSSLRRSTKKKKKVQKSEKAQKSDMDVESQNTIIEEEKPDVFDLWNNEGEANAKAKKMPKSFIPAVEVDPPGCSYNPPFEAHQDALAQAVADEIQKVYRQELAPQPLPNVALAAEIDEQTESLDLSFAHDMQKVCQDDLSIPLAVHDSGTNEDKLLLDAAENNSEMDSDSDALQLTTGRKKKDKRVTRVMLNRRIRHKELLKAEAEAKRKKKLSKEIESLKVIMKEIKEEDEEKQNRHTRRVVAKKERLKACPPRLGKHKFKPAPMQVLLTEQISGSLRKLEGCPTLIRHQYKSLEKRGLIVPKANK